MSAALMMATLIISMHNGGAASVAAYSAGVSAVSIISVLTGGGTSLAYVSGNLTTQRAVRNVRLKIVLPATLTAALIASLWYAGTTELALYALALGGLTALLNNLSEIEAGFLRRQLHTPTLLTIEISARSAALSVALVGADFAPAMAVAALLRFALLAFTARDDPSRVGAFGMGMKQATALAYRPSLFWITVMYAVGDRLIFVVAPFVGGATVAGYVAAMISGLQAISGALVSGLQTILATRSEHEGHISWARNFELVTATVALMVAAAGVALTPVVLHILNVPATSNFRLTWMLLCVSLPFAVVNRALQFRFIHANRSSDAVKMLFASCLVTGIFGLAAVLSGATWVLGAALLAGEGIGTILGLVIFASNRDSSG